MGFSDLFSAADFIACQFVYPDDISDAAIKVPTETTRMDVSAGDDVSSGMANCPPAAALQLFKIRCAMLADGTYEISRKRIAFVNVAAYFAYPALGFFLRGFLDVFVIVIVCDGIVL